MKHQTKKEARNDTRAIAKNVVDAAREACAMTETLAVMYSTNAQVGLGIGMQDIAFRCIDDLKQQLDFLLEHLGIEDIRFHKYDF